MFFETRQANYKVMEKKKKQNSKEPFKKGKITRSKNYPNQTFKYITILQKLKVWH